MKPAELERALEALPARGKASFAAASASLAARVYEWDGGKDSGPLDEAAEYLWSIASGAPQEAARSKALAERIASVTPSDADDPKHAASMYAGYGSALALNARERAENLMSSAMALRDAFANGAGETGLEAAKEWENAALALAPVGDRAAFEHLEKQTLALLDEAE